MVRNILKDGTEVNDLTGKIVKLTDAESAYKTIEAIEQRKGFKHGRFAENLGAETLVGT